MSSDLLASPVRDVLASVAAKTPTPGGGAVTALAGSLAAAQAQMVLQYTLGKKKFAAYEPELQAAMGQFQRSSELLQALVKEDMAAYDALSPLLKLPPDQRLQDPQYLPTLLAAVGAPQTMAATALHSLELCVALQTKVNPLLLSDLAIAAVLCHATVQAGELCVRVNLPLFPNPADAEELRQQVAAFSAKADAAWAEIRRYAHSVLA